MIRFEGTFELGEDIIETVNDREEDVVVLDDYENMKKLIIDLIYNLEEVDIVAVEISEPEFDGYDGPWLLTLSNDWKLYCEKGIREKSGKIPYFDGYLYARKKYIDKAIKDTEVEKFTVYGYEWDDDEDDFDEDEPKSCFKWDDDKHLGFSFCMCLGGGEHQRRLSYKGTTKLSDKDVDKIIKSWLED